MSITHGYGGFTQIDTVRVLCRPGARLAMPRNQDAPHPISYQQYGLLNYVDGLRFPVLQLPCIPMDMGGVSGGVASWFTSALMNAWFMSRSAMPVHDLTAVANGILFSDNGIVSGPGLGSFKITQPKGAGLVIQCRKGQPLQIMLRFAGVDIIGTGISAPAAGLQGTPLNFGRVLLDGDFLNKGITGFTLMFDTGLTPNMELDGTERPKEQNADIMTGSLTLECNAQAVDYPGFNNADLNDFPEVSGAISILRQRANSGTGASDITTVFDVTRAVIQDPVDRAQQQGRVMRTYQYNLFANTTTPPIAISEA